ncbi:MAG: glutamate racemase [Beijerinckiaceae bacterium]
MILVFDSGLGGLTVYRELAKLAPDTPTVYLADDAAFPYGALDEAAVTERVMAVMAAAFAVHMPDAAIVACNTASTSVLPHLRAQWPEIAFVGTVPAVKPAAEQSQSRMITVLGTSGTVRRDYTHGLIRDHAGHCDVKLVGSENLAALAEAHAHGQAVTDDALIAELAPCFAEIEGRRTDHIVLACTHYPLLLSRFEELAGERVGWPVTFVDPAAAIARQAVRVLEQRPARRETVRLEPVRQVWTSSGQADARSHALFVTFGLTFAPGFRLDFDRSR